MGSPGAVVTLSGHVGSSIEIKRAVEIVLSVTGVKGVTTSLAVGNRCAGQPLDDSVIVTEINFI